jgi:signal transduction histidine kinase
MNTFDSAEATQADPQADFPLRRRVTALLLASTLLLPLCLLAGWGWLALHDAFADAERQCALLARVVQEHASKVMESNRLADQRLRDLTVQWSNADIRHHELELHRRMARMGRRLPQAFALGIFGDDGTLLVSSLLYPAPMLNIAEREDYRAIMVDREPMHLSAVLIGGVIPEPVFKASMPRMHGQRLAGIVSIALRPSYFADFYRQLLENTDGYRAALVRSDGAVLAAYPWPDPDAARFAAVVRHARDSDGPQRIERADGHAWLVTVHPIGDGVASAMVSVPYRVIYRAWWRRMAPASLAAGVVSAVLCLSLWSALRRIRAEEAVRRRWRDERARREQLEKRYRQSRKFEAMGQLIGSVAHDFRNVLAVISAYTDVLLLRTGVAGSSERAERADRANRTALAGIRKSLASGALLAERLLGVVRRREHRREAIALQEELQQCDPLIRATLGSGIALRYAVSADCLPVLADRCELGLALLNLAANARDAMPEGGVLEIGAANLGAAYGGAATLPPGLAARAASEEPSDDAHRAGHRAESHAEEDDAEEDDAEEDDAEEDDAEEDDAEEDRADDDPRDAAAPMRGVYVRIWVSDSGIGMPAHVADRALEPLFTTKPDGAGTGLGLSQVSDFCREAGGAVTVRSAPGKGTTVTLFLPACQPSRRA